MGPENETTEPAGFNGYAEPATQWNSRTGPAMPPAIAKAVCSVMAQVMRLDKDTRNKQGGYNYVSVDQFYEAIGPLMSKAGLFTVAFETSMEVVEKLMKSQLNL